MMALSQMYFNRVATLRQICERVGSATEIVDNLKQVNEMLSAKGGGHAINPENLKIQLDQAYAEAERAESKGVECISIDMPTYPSRMRTVTDDAPLVLYKRGNANLNAHHILSIVGTRGSTSYGRDVVDKFVSDLAVMVPDLLIVSGLAYGTDVNAHRAALDNNLATAAVLGHGLGTIYPAPNRRVAERMVDNGALISEHYYQKGVDQYNFLRRNRIIAGLAQGTLVVESKVRGGSLSTARLAVEYGLEVMAVPGRIYDETSEGCNNLIRHQKAAAVTSASQIVELLGWEAEEEGRRGRLPSLFDDQLVGDERLIYSHLNEEGVEVNKLTALTHLPISQVMALLAELEFKGVVRQVPGAKWRKIM